MHLHVQTYAAFNVVPRSDKFTQHELRLMKGGLHDYCTVEQGYIFTAQNALSLTSGHFLPNHM